MQAIQPTRAGPMSGSSHDEDDLYNQGVLDHIAKVVRDAERDAEAGWQHMQDLAAASQIMQSALNAAHQHLSGACNCTDGPSCRQRTLQIVTHALQARGNRAP